MPTTNGLVRVRYQPVMVHADVAAIGLASAAAGVTDVAIAVAVAAAIDVMRLGGIAVVARVAVVTPVAAVIGATGNRAADDGAGCDAVAEAAITEAATAVSNAAVTNTTAAPTNLRRAFVQPSISSPPY